MKWRLWGGIAILSGMAALSGAFAWPLRPQMPGDATRAGLIDRTAAALFEQIRCQQSPEVARAINAMLKNRLIRYVDNESGIYLFAPTAPLTFLGLPVTHISGFDMDARFNGVPDSTMVGTAPPVFLQIDVAAPAAELRRRALDAGLIEAVPREGRHGFEVSGEGSYLAPATRAVTSSIQCVYS